MKKRRFKKKRVKEDTNQVVKVFDEVDIPSSPVPTKSTIYCLFCYKLTSIENNGESPSQPEKLATCHRFYKNVSNEKFPFVGEAYGTKCGVCDDCYYVVDNHCKLHFEVECLQLRLRWQLYKLFRVMKYAGRVPSRVKLFKESLMTEKMTNGDSVSLEGVLDFRQKLYDKSSRRLKNKKPRVLLSNGQEFDGSSKNSSTKPKGRGSKQGKNKMSQGTQTLVEFSDIACNTSETGNMEIDKQPIVLEQVKGSDDGSQSKLETEKTAKSKEGCQNNKSKICSVCGMHFKRKRNLNLHMKSHQENDKATTEASTSKLEISKCKHCPGGFSDGKKLESHENSQFCSKMDENATTVILSEVAELRSWRFKAECPECRVVFTERSQEQLNTLIKFHLELSEVHARIVDSWIHVCQFCGIRFQYNCHYKTHLALHEEHLEMNDKDEASDPKILNVRSLTGRRRVGRPRLNRFNNQGTISKDSNSSGRRPVGRPRLNRLNNQGTISKDSSGRRPVGRPSFNRRNDNDHGAIAITKDKSGKKVFVATCKKCGKTYHNWTSQRRANMLLQSHLQSKFHSGDRNYKFCCLICDRKYPGESQLLVHLRSNIHNSKASKTNLANQMLKCDKCPGAFLSQVKLKNHKKDGKKFCKNFGKSEKDFSKKLDFNYVCNFCSMYFQEKGHLRKHINLHKANPIPDSKEDISNEDEMDTYNDITGADGDIEIVIDNAEQSYYDIGEVNPPQPTNPLFKCIICNEICASEEILVEHARTKHWPSAAGTSDSKKDLEPKATNKKCVIEREDGVINIKTYRGDKDPPKPKKDPFVCIVCKMPYKNLSSLNSHMRVTHDIIITPVGPPPVNNVPTQQAPNNDDDDDIEIIENDIEEVAEEQEIQISALGCETTSSNDNAYPDPLEAQDEPQLQPQPSEGHASGKKLMEMKCQVCSKTFMGWSKSYLLATLKEHSEQHPIQSPLTIVKPIEELQDNSSVPIPLISIDDMADGDDESMDVEEDATSTSEEYIEVRKSSHNPSYAYEGECPKCGKLFYGKNGAHTRQYVQRHLRSKMHGGGGTNYKSCDNCGKRFRTKTLLEEHQMTACEASDGVEIVNEDGGDDADDFPSGPRSQLVLREIFKCCHCSKTFSTQQKLASHEGARQCFNDNDESDHDGGDAEDEVEIEESNPQEVELSSDSEYSPEYENAVTKRKQLTQLETEIFKCPVDNCNTFFTSNEDMDCHLAIHVDFACAFCDFRTKSPYDLMDHENNLHAYYVAEKNLKCSRCPEVFDLSENLNSHRVHFLHDHLGIEGE